MPARITIACSHCGARLNLTDDSKLGKKIKCPKCEEVFVAEEAEDADEDSEENEDDEQPKRQAANATSGKKGKPAKGKAKSSGGGTGLIIGAAVGVGVLLIGGLVGLLFATGILGGSAKPDPNQIAITPGSPNGAMGKLVGNQSATSPAPAAGQPMPPETTTAATPSAATVPQVSPPANTNPASAAIPARSPVPEMTRWLREDTEAVIHIRVADILVSPLISEMLRANQLEETINAPLAAAGLKLADIESVTLGISGFEKAAAQAQDAQFAVMMGQTPAVDSPTLGVLKLKQPITYDAIQKLAGETTPLMLQEHAGKQYLQGTAPDSPKSGGVWLASETELVFGDDVSLKTAMERSSGESPVKNFGFIDWTDHLTFALAPRNSEYLRSQAPPQNSGNPLLDRITQAFINGTRGVSLGLTIKGGIEAEVAIGCQDDEKMEAIVKAMEDGISLAKLQYDQTKKDLPPWAAELTDQLMANLKIDGNQQVATVTTNLPDSTQSQLAALPAMIMTQFMMSAMMSGGGLDGTLNSDMFKRVTVTPESGPENIKLEATLTSFDIPKPGSRATKSKKNERTIDMSISAQWTGDRNACLLAAGGKLKPRGGEISDGKKIKVALDTSGSEAKANESQPVLLSQFAEPSVTLGRLVLTVPNDETGPLKSVSGVCQIVTGVQIKQVTVENIRRQVGKEPEDEALKEAGFQVKQTKTKGPNPEDVLVISVKEGYILSRPEFIDADGNPLSGGMGENDKNERSQRLVLISLDGKVPKDFGIQAWLYGELQETSVPFTFEDVELPETQTFDSSSLSPGTRLPGQN